MIRIGIRADASVRTGSGHVMRCLTLAQPLRQTGAEIAFICQEIRGNLIDLIESSGFRAIALSTPEGDWEADATATCASLGQADWVIVDHYGLDWRWESRVRQVAARIMTIDDLADRRHDCNLLLDQNLVEDMDSRYLALLPATCRKLIGPHFALLRPEFRLASQKHRDGDIRRIFVFFGAGDPDNETTKALDAISLLNRPEIAVDVVVGASNPNFDSLSKLCRSLPNVTLHRQVGEMAKLMSKADLSIGAGGTITWERCALGLPSIVISIAANQEKGALAVANSGASIYLGRSEDVTVERILSALKHLLEDGRERLAMSECGKRLVDGLGTNRVANAIMELTPEWIGLRQAAMGDSADLFEWRNAAETRKYSHDPREISPDEHERWIESTLGRNDRHLLIGEVSGRPVGVLRYDLEGEIAVVSVYLVPGQHGKGLGTALIRAGIFWAKDHLPETRVLRASIHPDNIASRKAFVKAGYRESGGYFEFSMGE